MSGYMLHIIRQITTDRNYNRTLLKNRRGKKSELISKQNSGLKFNEVSEEQLKIIKLNIRNKGKKRRLRITILTLIFTAIISCGIYYILIKIIS